MKKFQTTDGELFYRYETAMSHARKLGNRKVKEVQSNPSKNNSQEKKGNPVKKETDKKTSSSNN